MNATQAAPPTTFRLDEAVPVLEATPGVLRALLAGTPREWLKWSEGPAAWNPGQVVAHLVEAERELWVPRMDAILRSNSRGAFSPFDRDNNLNRWEEMPIAELVQEFATLRSGSLHALRTRRLTDADLHRTGIHPEFGAVSLAQLLSTWTAHDLAHLAQITRTMARRYREDVGPWRAYIRTLQ